jgi:hypothetical protein
MDYTNMERNVLSITFSPHADKEFHQSQKLMKEKYHLENFLFVSKKENQCAHLFAFSSTNPELPLKTIFTNNLAIINQFYDFFLTEWQPYHKFMESFLIDLGEVRRSSYFQMYSPLKRQITILRNSIFYKNWVSTMKIITG